MVFPLKGWGVHGPSCSGVCGCFVCVWFNLVLGIGTQCMTQGAGCGCSGHLRWPFRLPPLFSSVLGTGQPPYLCLWLLAGLSDIQLNRGPPGAAIFGAGVCYLSGLFSSPGPGEGGVVSGELLALAFGSGRFGWLSAWVWVCCFPAMPHPLPGGAGGEYPSCVVGFWI